LTCLFGVCSFEQSSGQLTLPTHCPTHHDIAAGHFVGENVLIERPGNEKEAPFAQTRVSETASWPQIRMLAQQPARGLNRLKVTIAYFSTRLGQVPIELALNIGNEIVRLADVHAPERGLYFPARCRIPSKSVLVSGVAGWSAASRSQASSLGVISNSLRCSRLAASAPDRCDRFQGYGTELSHSK
jgi:hypothetical protein